MVGLFRKKKKKVSSQKSLVLQKSSNIDFWLAAKHGFLQYCQKRCQLKDISSVL